MKHKKLSSLLLAALLLTVPADAANGGFHTKFDVPCSMPEVKVSVPATGKLLINPYEMSVNMEDGIVQDQIVSVPGCILNESPVPIQVDVQIISTVKKGSDMTLSPFTTKDSGSTKKRAFIYFEIQPTDTEDPASSIWESTYNAEKHVVVRTTAKTKKNIVQLGAAEEKGCYGAFRLTGDCVATPKNAWTETDGIDVEITFTFTPLARPGI